MVIERERSAASVQSTDFSRAVPWITIKSIQRNSHELGQQFFSVHNFSSVLRHCPTKVGTLNARLL